MTYGYVRVSTKEQNEDRQMDAMLEQGILPKNIFIDKQSGKNFERSLYQRLVRKMKKGDLLYIKSIDRLGRNYEEILEQWRFLTKDRGVDIVVIDMPLLDTRLGKDLIGAFLSDIVLQLLSFVAENERDNIHQRQAEGIAAAKARGVRFGRPPIETPVPFEPLAEKWIRGEVDTEEACKQLGLERSCFHHRVRKKKREKDVQKKEQEQEKPAPI